MAIGLPVLGLATTELVRTIENGVTGYIDTDVNRLIERGRELLASPSEAARMGANARAVARERFGIERFARDWERTFALVAGGGSRSNQASLSATG